MSFEVHFPGEDRCHDRGNIESYPRAVLFAQRALKFLESADHAEIRESPGGAVAVVERLGSGQFQERFCNTVAFRKYSRKD